MVALFGDFGDAVASDRNEIKAMADYVTDTADDEIHIASKHFGII